jgi:hypothetical protein
MVFFDTDTGAILNSSVETGYHPDMVTFDGTRFVVANEGEPVAMSQTALDDPAGSITVLDAPAYDDIAGLGAGAATTYDFSAANLDAGVTLTGLRINPANAGGNEYLDMEPEYISVQGDKAYVSLQENNALAEFDLSTGKWTAINDLGTIEQTVDASNRDNVAAIDDVMPGLPMPDAIATFQSGGQTYIVTANEGDAREYIWDEDGPNETDVFVDEDRFDDVDIDPATMTALDTLYGGAGEATKDENLGRLKLSTIDGNIDGDPSIEVPTMFGTRSFTIWDTVGTNVFDSGSDFEQTTLSEVPTIFNSDESDPGEWDDRSDDKGPEPEGVVIGSIHGIPYAFIGLERVGGVMMYDISQPTLPAFVDYYNSYDLASPGAGPEGMDFFQIGDDHYLIIGYEDSDTVEVLRVVPEPASFWLLGLAAAAVVSRRRSRANKA